MANRKAAGREEFRVVISGLDLTDEHRERINAAVQRAALQAVADLDFRGDRAAVVFPVSPESAGRLPEWWKNLGQTRGIWIGDLEQQGFETWIKGQ